MEYLKQVKFNEVASEEILPSKVALKTLKNLAEVDVNYIYENRFYRKGELVEFEFILKDGTKLVKKATGTSLINTLCSLANVNLLRISKEGVQESKLIGYIIKPIN